MSIHLGDIAPDFTAESTEGTIHFHDWKAGSWAVFFSHPADFTPVCTTELGRTAALNGEFTARNVKKEIIEPLSWKFIVMAPPPPIGEGNSGSTTVLSQDDTSQGIHRQEFIRGKSTISSMAVRGL